MILSIKEGDTMRKREISWAPGYFVQEDGQVWSSKTNKYLSQSLSDNRGHGYLVVHLYVNGKSYSPKVHRLVAEAFLPNPDELPQVNHKDENVLNNHVENLEWCTEDYNRHYGTRYQRMAETLKLVQPNKEQVGAFLDGELVKDFISVSEAARWTGDIKHRPNLVACLRGRQKTAYGYQWRYLQN